MPTIEETVDDFCLKSEKMGVMALQLQLYREIVTLRESSPILGPYLDLFRSMVDVAAAKLNNPVTSPSNEALSEPM